MPREDCEYPFYHPGKVRIGNIVVPIDVEDMAWFRLPAPVTSDTGSLIEHVSLRMMTHPFSLRVEPQGRMPAGLDMATATRAVEHLRNASLRFSNANLREGETSMFRPERADVVIV